MNMRNIDGLISEWKVAADSDGKPPVVTAEEQKALAGRVLMVRKELRGIRSLPFIGLTLEQEQRKRHLSSEVNKAYCFLRETMGTKDNLFVEDAVVEAFVTNQTTSGLNLRRFLHIG